MSKERDNRDVRTVCNYWHLLVICRSGIRKAQKVLSARWLRGLMSKTSVLGFDTCPPKSFILFLKINAFSFLLSKQTLLLIPYPNFTEIVFL